MLRVAVVLVLCAAACGNGDEADDWLAPAGAKPSEWRVARDAGLPPDVQRVLGRAAEGAPLVVTSGPSTLTAVRYRTGTDRNAFDLPVRSVPTTAP